VGEIPVHIGAKELKKIAFIMLLPHFLRWSHNYPLTIENTAIRHKNWQEIIPREPRDVNAISDKFFHRKGQDKTPKFVGGQGLDVYVTITNDTYQLALSHRHAIAATQVRDCRSLFSALTLSLS
jgi:hypothetical protein